MSKKTSKNQEFDHFSSIANEWWRPEGKFKILHQIVPIRIGIYFTKYCKEKNKKIRYFRSRLWWRTYL